MNPSRTISTPGVGDGRDGRRTTRSFGPVRIVRDRSGVLAERRFALLLAALAALLLGGCAPTFTLCGDDGCATFERSAALWLDVDTGGAEPPRRVELELRPLATFVSGRRVPDPDAPPPGTPFDVWVGSLPPGLDLQHDPDPGTAGRLVSDLPPLRVGERLVLHVVGGGRFDAPEEIEFVATHPRYGFARATIVLRPAPLR